jgi:hypothetical protein
MRSPPKALSDHNQARGWVETQEIVQIARYYLLGIAPSTDDDMGVRDVRRATGGQQYADAGRIRTVERCELGGLPSTTRSSGR